MSSMGIGLTAPGFKSRADVLTLGQGMIAETYPRAAATTGIPMVSGTVYYLGVGLLTGDLISKVSLVVTGAAAASTLAKVGLCSSTGARLAISADLTTSWESTGTKTHSFITPYTVPADGLYYAALVFTGTTGPSVHASANTGNAAPGIGTGSLAFGTLAAQTDIPATATIVNAAAKGLWAGVS